METLSPLTGTETIRAVIRLSDGTTIECRCATIAVEEIEDGWRYRLSFRDLDNDGAARLEELIAA